jgi:hypothetical protein
MIRICLVIFLFLSTMASAQEERTELPSQPVKERKPFRERLFISPDLGLQFGTVTLINVAPKIGYRITDRFASGIGATYIYIKDKRYQSYGYTYESSIYGGSVFSQYQLFEPVRLYAEYEMLSLESFDLKNGEVTRRIVPALLAGGGYTSRIGEYSSFGIMVLFDLLESTYSIYENPVIRIGLNLGL